MEIQSGDMVEELWPRAEFVVTVFKRLRSWHPTSKLHIVRFEEPGRRMFGADFAFGHVWVQETSLPELMKNPQVNDYFFPPPTTCGSLFRQLLPLFPLGRKG